MAKLVSADLTGDKLCTLTYTTTDGKMLSFDEDTFDAKIISHSYTNMGIVMFDKLISLIGVAAFESCQRLTSITIPNSVIAIGEMAFCDCDNLMSVTIPDSVTKIGNEAFALCNSLTSIAIPNSVIEIGNYTFSECSSLTSVSIPNSVTEIGRGAFACCTKLKAFYGKYASSDNRCLVIDGVLNSFAPAGLIEYTIPNGITSIGDSAFESCSSLASITIPNSVTSIDYRAFSGCSSLTAFYGKFASMDNRCLIVCGVLNSFAPAKLTEYTIPNSVTEIGDWAFDNCDSLTSVTIPNSVTSIGWWVFSDCISLKTVICKAEIPPKLGRDALPEFETLIVPEGCEEAYLNSDWRKYIVEEVEGNTE